MLEINSVVGRIKISARFADKVNILTGYSGSGKSFLLSLIERKYADSSLSVAIFDYNPATENNVEEYIRRASHNNLVLLNNADLYMTSELFEILAKGECTVIAELKHAVAGSVENSGLYIVNFENDTIGVKKVR